MDIKPLSAVGTALLALFLSLASYAKDYGQGRENLAPSLLLENGNGQNDHWKGIGRLQMYSQHPQAHCTATLIDTRDNQGNAAGPAYVLTAGHCFSFNSINLTVDMPSDGHIDFNYFHDIASSHQRYGLKTINLSRLRGLDMAVVELDASLQTLIDRGIDPLQLADAAPKVMDNLLIVGAPSKYAEKGLRLSTCSHVSTEHLIEHPGVFQAFYKNHCLGLKPGSSGSPLLDRSSNKVVGLLSTSTFDSKEENRCFENTPCELKRGRPHWSARSNYSSPTNFLNKCFSHGKFTPTAVECNLQPGFTTTPKNPNRIRYYKRVTEDSAGRPVLPTWNFAFRLDKPFYRYKTVQDPLLCENPDFYSQALDASNALINDAVGPTPGMYLLCIVGVDSPEQVPTWPMMKNPLLIAMEVAAPGSTPPPKIDIRKQNEGGYNVAWHFSLPTLGRYEYKAGKPEATNCDEPEGYLQEVNEVQFPASELPLKLCTQVFDMAGQGSLPRSDLLEAS